MIDSLPEQCSGLTDFELVELIKNKNLSAFEELMSRYERQVYSLSLRIIGKPEGAQEAVQDTFLSVFKNISSFKGNSAFKTWIYRIVL